MINALGPLIQKHAHCLDEEMEAGFFVQPDRHLHPGLMAVPAGLGEQASEALTCSCSTELHC